MDREKERVLITVTEESRLKNYMTEVQHVTEVAKGISDYGMMAVSAA